MRIGLFGAFGIGNLGNDASARTMIGLLRAQDSEVRITAVSRSGADPDLLGVPVEGFTRMPPSRHRRRRLTSKIGDLGRLLGLVRGFDLVVVPGTGLLEETERMLPGGELTWLLLLTVACAVRRVPIAWFALGGARRMTPVPRLLTLAAASATGYHSFRDTMTAASLGRRRAARRVVVPDVVFGSAASQGDAPSEGVAPSGGTAPVVAVAVIDFDPPDETAKRRYFAELTAAVAALLERGWIVRFVVGDGADVAHTEVVRLGLAERHAGMEAPAIVPPGDLAALVAVLGGVDVVVAARYHVLLAAALASRPMVALSHADKDDALMTGFGLPHFVLPAGAFSAADLVALIEQSRTDAARVQGVLHECTTQARAAVTREFARSGIGTGALHR